MENKKNHAYLVFYNCISFVFFPYERELSINKYDEGFLGIIITKYLKYSKEIIINYINEDNDGYTNLFKNRIKIDNKNKEIIVLDGKDDERELIACFKYDEKKDEDKDELIIYYKNENKVENEIKIKVKIINKMKDMNGIIERKELELTKWNINNVTNLGRLFYNYESLSSLPDISKWNTNNVSDMSYLFYGCINLLTLPDILQWNTNKVTNMKALFYNCKSLSNLPKNEILASSLLDNKEFLGNLNNSIFWDLISKWYNDKLEKYNYDISEWNINKVTDISYLFYNCESLTSLPDISEWITNNITDISYLFYNCESLTSLPDISE